MKRAILTSLLFSAGVIVAMAFSPSADSGKNFPVVHSFDDGRHFVRSIPAETYGSSGKTEMYRVTKDGDELVEKYSVYMWGDLFFARCPDQLGWGIVQLEPVRISDPNDADKPGGISRLAFYRAGKEIREYTHEELAEMSLRKNTNTLVAQGDFLVQGIIRDFKSSRAFFTLTTRSENATSKVIVAFDACTGELLDAEQ